MHVAKYNKENEIHLIFFHGIGDNYKNAARYIQDRSTYLHRSNFYTHAHKYPIVFQNYITYAKRLKILKGLTPYEFICGQWTKSSELFILNPHYHSLGLYTRLEEELGYLEFYYNWCQLT